MTGVYTSVLMTVVIFERKASSEEPVSIFIPPKMEGFFFPSLVANIWALGLRVYMERILSLRILSLQVFRKE